MIRTQLNRLIAAGIALLLALAGSAAGASESEKPSLSIVYDSFARFIYTEDDRAKGLYVNIMVEALEHRLGVPVEFVLQPWQRAQFSVREGVADAMITVATPDRLMYANAGEVPVAISRIGLFTARDHPRFEQMQEITSLQDLEDFRILTYLGDGWAEEFLEGLRVDYDAGDFLAVFRKLAWGRGDVFPQIEDVTRHYISELAYEDEIVQVPGVELGNIQFRLMISKRSPFVSLLPRIDTTLREMKQDGTLKRLEARYRPD